VLRQPQLATLLVSLLLVAVGNPAFAQAKIGFVSLERILKEAPMAQLATKRIELEISKRDQELGVMADQLKKMQENLEKNAMTMAESERQKLERDLNDQNRKFQQKQREFREELQAKRNEEYATVIQQANKVINNIADAEGFDIIFQDAVWHSGRIDITSKVIEGLGSESGSTAAPTGAATKPAATPAAGAPAKPAASPAAKPAAK
jgi:outer membrane protein